MTHGKIKLLAIKCLFPHVFGEDAPIDGGAIITGLLSTVYKMDTAKIEETLALGDPAKILDILHEADKARVKAMRTQIEKEKFQEGYKKAKGEVLTAAETSLKEKYGIESDATGDALIDEIITAKTGEVAGKTEEDIKKTPTYIAMEKRLLKEKAEAIKAGEDKLKQTEETYKKEGAFTKVGKSALEILAELNPVLPKDAKAAEKQKQWFLNEFKGYEFEVQEDGNIIVMKDSKVLVDEHNNTKSFETLVKEIAGTSFEFAVNNGGENGGNNNDANKDKPQNGGPKGYPKGAPALKDIKTMADLTKVITTPGMTAADKRIVRDAWNEANGINKG